MPPACASKQQKADSILHVWFENVELIAAQEHGQETVTYVGNIYKYYVAYKLAVEQTGATAEDGERQMTPGFKGRKRRFES